MVQVQCFSNFCARNSLFGSKHVYRPSALEKAPFQKGPTSGLRFSCAKPQFRQHLVYFFVKFTKTAFLSFSSLLALFPLAFPAVYMTLLSRIVKNALDPSFGALKILSLRACGWKCQMIRLCDFFHPLIFRRDLLRFWCVRAFFTACLPCLCRRFCGWGCTTHSAFAFCRCFSTACFPRVQSAGWRGELCAGHALIF